MDAANSLPQLLEAIAAVDGDPDRVFHALSTPRNRFLLAHLDEAGEPIDLDVLARDIAAWELRCPREEISEQTAGNMLVSLYHVNVPKMNDAALVEFDPDARTVTISKVGHELRGQPCIPAVDSS